MNEKLWRIVREHVKHINLEPDAPIVWIPRRGWRRLWTEEELIVRYGIPES